MIEKQSSLKVTKQEFCDLISPFGVESETAEKLWETLEKANIVLVDKAKLQDIVDKTKEDKFYGGTLVLGSYLRAIHDFIKKELLGED